MFVKILTASYFLEILLLVTAIVFYVLNDYVRCINVVSV